MYFDDKDEMYKLFNFKEFQRYIYIYIYKDIDSKFTFCVYTFYYRKYWSWYVIITIITEHADLFDESCLNN